MVFKAVFEIETVPFYNNIPAPEDFTFEILYPNRIPLIWNYNVSGIDGFKIFRKIGVGNWLDVTTINYNDTWNWTDYSFEYGEYFHYKVLAIYNEIYSDFSNELIFNITEIFWYDGPCVGGIGMEGGGSVDFDVAIRFTPSDLTQYTGASLVQIEFFPYSSSCEYSIRVWTGGSVSGGEGYAGTRIVDQLVLNPTIDQWNKVKLDNQIYIDSSEELWFGYRCNTQSGYPAGHDE